MPKHAVPPACYTLEIHKEVRFVKKSLVLWPLIPYFYCVLVSSSAIWTKGSSLGLPNWASAADQPTVRSAGHPGGSLDGETWFWKAQILCSSRERYRLLINRINHLHTSFSIKNSIAYKPYCYISLSYCLKMLQWKHTDVKIDLTI